MIMDMRISHLVTKIFLTKTLKNILLIEINVMSIEIKL